MRTRSSNRKLVDHDALEAAMKLVRFAALYFSPLLPRFSSQTASAHRPRHRRPVSS